MNQAKDILKKYWGYDAFRPTQEAVVQSVLEGKDCMALLPTGGGKSLCYQVPALMMDGLCIVVSPLIALMRDQVSSLRKRNIIAYAIYSGMPNVEVDRILDNCIYGKVKLLYLSPERLSTPMFQERLGRMKISFVAVDEAHCISQWGHDFRPAYRSIESALTRDGDRPQFLAVTATATPQVQKDILDSLSLKEVQVHQAAMDRPNLSYVVRKEADKLSACYTILNKVGGQAIIYVRNRRRTKSLALRLRDMKIPAVYYHAGLSAEDRKKMQDHWFEGKSRVIVCTNAFGMGIDKGDVRVVIHMDLPDSPEAYFQEAGRAGRDGERAYAVILYKEEDIQGLVENHQKRFPPVKYVKRIYTAIGSYLQLATGSGLNEHFSFDIGDFCRKFDFDILEAIGALNFLEMQGYLEIQEHALRASSFQIVQSKEAVYHYQVQHRKMDGLLNALLRLHDGAFHQLVKVKEKQLSSFLNISEQELKRGMEHLQQAELIDYHPRKEKPQLFFPVARLAAENLLFDMKSKRHLEEAAKSRMEQMISYLEGEACRSRFMQSYFGAEKDVDCGICDRCIAGLHDKNQKTNYKEIESELIEMVRSGRGVDVAVIKGKYVGVHRYALARNVIKDLLDEEWFSIKNGKLYWNG